MSLTRRSLFSRLAAIAASLGLKPVRHQAPAKRLPTPPPGMVVRPEVTAEKARALQASSPLPELAFVPDYLPIKPDILAYMEEQCARGMRQRLARSLGGGVLISPAMMRAFEDLDENHWTIDRDLAGRPQRIRTIQG